MRILDVLSQLSNGAVLSTGISPWLEAFWSLTISINIITTSITPSFISPPFRSAIDSLDRLDRVPDWDGGATEQEIPRPTRPHHRFDAQSPTQPRDAKHNRIRDDIHIRFHPRTRFPLSSE
jgi:hypothetical protein